MWSSPAVAHGVVYVGSQDDNIYALNAKTGILLWKHTTGGGVGSSPAVANGVVYVGSQDNKVYALNARTGNQLWAARRVLRRRRPVRGLRRFARQQRSCLRSEGQ